MKIHSVRKWRQIVVHADDEFVTRVALSVYGLPKPGRRALLRFHAVDGLPSVLDVLRMAREIVTEGVMEWDGERRQPTYQTGKWSRGLHWNEWNRNGRPAVMVHAWRKRNPSGITVEAVKALMDEAVAALERQDAQAVLTQTDEFETMELR